MLFYPQERIAIFVDGANLYGAAKGLQFDIDYKRLLELFARKGVLVRAFYYTALAEEQEFSPLAPADRLARLQRLHRRHQAAEGIHRRARAPARERQHGHRARDRRDGDVRARRPHRHLLGRRRFQETGRSRAAQGHGVSRCARPSAPSRRWWPTNCAARPTISSSSKSSSPMIMREGGGARRRTPHNQHAETA